MSKKPAEIGVVGLGWWSDVLANCVKDSSLIKFTACFSRNAEKRNKFAATFNCQAADSLDTLLATPSLDGVIVTTPNNAHLEIVKAAAKAGKHVFVEKPIANSIGDALEIERICREANVVLSVGHSYRRHAGIRHIAELIKRDELGRISLAEGVFSKNHGLRLSGPQDWRFRRAEVPGGCLMQIGIHHIDNLIYLLGEVVDVASMLAHLETRAEIEDVGAVLLRFKSGAIGFICADYISADRFELTISGTKSIARFDLQSGVSVLAQGSKSWVAANIKANDYLRAQMEEFASCVVSGARPEVGAREALAPLAVIHAAIKSAEEHRTVAISEITASDALFAASPDRSSVSTSSKK
jgi:predicted dehydrogenase